MRALRYAFDEAVASLWRGRGSGAFSAATIALALFVLGAFLIVTSNLERLGSEWSSSADMSVYLNDAVTAAERTAIEGVLETGDLVLARAYMSKADALARFRSTFADLASSMEASRLNEYPSGNTKLAIRLGTPNCSNRSSVFG